VLALGLHTYLAARLFLPLLLAGLLVIYRADLLHPRQAGTSLIRLHWSRPATPFLAGVLLVALPLVVWSAGHPAEFAGHAVESAGTGPLHRQALAALGRYAAYLGPHHLLTQGDPYPVPSTGRFGALLWPVAPFFLLGLVTLVRRRGPGDLLLLWWWLIYPLPAALTRGSHPDWLRAACGIGTLELIAVAGLLNTYDMLRSRTGVDAPRIAAAALTALTSLNLGWFLSDYAFRFPDRAAWAFTDGAATAVRRVAALEPAYARVILPADVPAVHDVYLFYARYDPRRLHAEGLEDVAAPGDWAEVRGFGKHRVCRPAACCGPGDLCLTRGPWSGPGEVLDVVHDRTGRIAFTIVAGR
jgi:hypothetical protein